MQERRDFLAAGADDLAVGLAVLGEVTHDPPGIAGVAVQGAGLFLTRWIGLLGHEEQPVGAVAEGLQEQGLQAVVGVRVLEGLGCAGRERYGDGTRFRGTSRVALPKVGLTCG